MAAPAAISFSNVTPRELQPYIPQSTVQSIIKRREAEFLPENSGTISLANGSRELRFNISDTEHFMIGSESYFQCDLDVEIGGASLTAASQRIRLETGGFHACIQQIEVRSNATGNTIQLCEYYNKWYTLQSRAQLKNYDRPPPESGDGIEFDSFGRGPLQAFTDADAGADIDAGEPLLVAPLGSALDGEVYTNETRKESFMPLMSMMPTSYFGYTSASTTINVSHKIRCKFLVSVLQSDLPLFVMKNGIQIIITLGPPGSLFYVDGRNAYTTADTVNYKVANARYIVKLMEPSKEYINQYSAKFRSDAGLYVKIPSYRVIRSAITNQNSPYFLLHPSVRSIRRVSLGFFHTVNQLNTTHAQSQVYYHSHIPMKIGFKSWQWRIGATDYPTRPVVCQSEGSYNTTYDISGLNNAPMIYQMTSSFQNPQMQWLNYTSMAYKGFVASTVSNEEGGPLKWPVVLTNGIKPEYVTNDAMWIVQDFSRDNGPSSELTGVDVSVTPLELRMDRQTAVHTAANGVSAAKDWQWWFGDDSSFAYTGFEGLFFIEHDAWMKITSQGPIILN